MSCASCGCKEVPQWWSRAKNRDPETICEGCCAMVARVVQEKNPLGVQAFWAPPEASYWRIDFGTYGPLPEYHGS